MGDAGTVARELAEAARLWKGADPDLPEMAGVRAKLAAVKP